MERKFEAKRVLLYIVIGMTVSVGLLITFAWFRPTPVYTMAGAEHPDCLAPAPDREVLIGLAVSGGGSRAALFALREARRAGAN